MQHGFDVFHRGEDVPTVGAADVGLDQGAPQRVVQRQQVRIGHSFQDDDGDDRVHESSFRLPARTISGLGRSERRKRMVLHPWGVTSVEQVMTMTLRVGIFRLVPISIAGLNGSSAVTKRG
ncbi:hypothetical protein ACFOLL_12150 [Falsochrobactrum ovis]|uniref:hypothetical protein n=1 Tax=Falsochrobactrum ovis TaxID=1293442 RepID=UPI000DB90E7F|nr:hypothetical protein [Falsochrobactrum ovis]